MPLPIVDHEISRTVNKLGDTGSLPDLHNFVISRVVQSLADVNSVIDLENSPDRITKLVEWLGMQGRNSTWIEGLFDALELAPYLGDHAALALASGSGDQFEIHTLIHGGALFIGIDSVAAGAVVRQVSESGYGGLPSFAAQIGAHDIVINVPPTGGWIELTLKGRIASGKLESWNILVNMDTGEVLPVTKDTRVSESSTLQELQHVQAEALLKINSLSITLTG